MKKLLIFLCLSYTALAYGQKRPELAPAPPMGWNSWNYFGKQNVDEKLIREVIDSMAARHMKDLGYEYIVVDGGWRDTVLGPNGELRADPEKFPSGMKALADYAHSKGFKFGLHTVPGTHDCGCDPVGGWGHEKVQVQQFIDWGLDFVKLDRCRFSLNPHPEGHPRKDPIWVNGWDKEGKNIHQAYATWSRLLRESNRDILLSASAYRFYDWYPALTNMGRTTGDIQSMQTGGPHFDNGKPNSIMGIAHKNNKSRLKAGNGYWNDPDMLVIGNGGLSPAEEKSHFALWCIMSAPLILGNDPRHMTELDYGIISNKLAISIDQDPTEQGKLLRTNDNTEVWIKKLRNGQYAALLLNLDKQHAHDIRITPEDVENAKGLTIQDVYEGNILGKLGSGFSRNIAPESSLFILLKP